MKSACRTIMELIEPMCCVEKDKYVCFVCLHPLQKSQSGVVGGDRPTNQTYASEKALVGLWVVPHSNDHIRNNASSSFNVDNPAIKDLVRQCYELQKLPQYDSNAVPIICSNPVNKPALAQA